MMAMTEETSPLVLNSIQVSKMLGVNVSTVKRWTDEGKLSCHKTVGGHRKFYMEHLTEFLATHQQGNPQSNLFPLQRDSDLPLSYQVVKGNFEVLSRTIVDLAMQNRGAEVQQIVNGLYLAQVPLYRIFDQVLTPALHRLGEMWKAGDLSIVEEHLATQHLRDSLIRLQGLVRVPQESIGTAMLVNLSAELHDIALKMVSQVLQERGYRVLFSGQLTPLSEIDRIGAKIKPDRLYISITYVADAAETSRELAAWVRMAEKYSMRVFVGGQGLYQLNFSHPLIGAPLSSLAQIQNH